MGWLGDRFISNKRERNAAHRASALDVADARGMTQFYHWPDSPLLNKQRNHLPEGMPYEETFNPAIPGGDLGAYLSEHLAYTAEKGGVVMIDIGGPGRATAASIEMLDKTLENKEHLIRVRKSLGVTLEDPHPDRRSSDAEHNHTVITGDIVQDKVEDDIDAWVGDDEVDLYLERLGGGSASLPKDPYWAARKIQRAYQRRGDRTIFLIQVPVSFNDVFYAWAKMLKETCAGQLEIGFQIGDTNGTKGGLANTALLIRKIPGKAPKELPMLDARTASSLPI